MKQPAANTSAFYIPTLDGWRAIAVGLVIGAHCLIMLKNNGSMPALLLEKVLSRAGIGVDIFFGLSGFLITTLLMREKQKSGTILLKSFYTRRLFRIVPPLAVYLLVILGLYRLNLIQPASWLEMSSSLLFFRNYVEGSWYTDHFWTLSIEEHFYLVIPLLIVLLDRRKLMVVSLLGILACGLIRYYEFSHPEIYGLKAHFRTETRFDALLWGSIVAQWHHSDRLRAMAQKWLTLPAAFAVVAAGLALLLIFDTALFIRTLMPIILPIMIYATVLHPASLPGRLLELSPVKYLGRMSYSLYIWQMLYFVLIERTLGWAQAFPGAFVMAFGSAWLSYRYVEKPMIALGHRISGKMAT